MEFLISDMDLLYLTLLVSAYAAGATVWTCVAIPRLQRDTPSRAGRQTEFFEEQVDIVTPPRLP